MIRKDTEEMSPKAPKKAVLFSDKDFGGSPEIL